MRAKVFQRHNFFTVLVIVGVKHGLIHKIPAYYGTESPCMNGNNKERDLMNDHKYSPVSFVSNVPLAGGLLVLLVLVCFLLASPVQAKTTIAKSASLGGNEKQATFETILSKKVPIKVFTLDKPYRVVIDLPEVKFKFPAGLGRKGKGMVSAYRYGLFAKGKSRIVIDVKVPVLIKKAYVTTPTSGKPARMIIKLARTTEAKFALSLSKRYLMQDLEPDKPAAVVKSAPPVVPAKQAPKPQNGGPGSRHVIIIDAGHGGVDPGAIGSKGTLEKNVVLAFSKILRKELLATGRYKVEMTRDIDTYIPLHERVKIGRNKGGSLFISIHADSISKRRRRRNRVRGASIYILSDKASDKEAKALAALENRSDIIAGVELPESANPVSNILIDLAQRETNALSAMFAKIQLKNMRGTVKLHGYKTRSAGFRVLKAPDTPSVLLELGYLSSIHDEKNLKSVKWQKKMAKPSGSR